MKPNCLGICFCFWSFVAVAQTSLVEFTATSFVVNENAGVAVVTVQRTGGTNLTVSVDYATVTNTATAGADYIAQNGTLIFAPGETLKPFTVSILDDGLVEGNEFVTLLLSNPGGGASLGVQSNAILTIEDNETVAVVDAGFDPGAGANHDVFAIALQPDGKILVGGQFTTFNNANLSRIARLHANGSVDLDFDPGTGADGDVYAVAVQADGKVVIGGAFTTVNGLTSQYVARLNTDGTVDTSFAIGTNVNNELRAIAVQPDGKILIAGRFTLVGGQGRNRVARLNEDGSLDTSFNPGSGVNNNVRVLALQADGKVLLGGQFTTVNGLPRNRIVRLNADGSLDPAFTPGSGVDDQVRAIAVATNGMIFIGGDFELCNGTNKSAVARLFPDGRLDLSFDQGDPDNDTVRGIALEPDGRVWIGGFFTTAGGVRRLHLARLKPDGSADENFDPGAGLDDEAFAVVLQPDGRVLAGGKFHQVNGVSRSRVARLWGEKSVNTVEFDAAAFPATETLGFAEIRVRRHGDSRAAASVEFRMEDGTALAGADYIPASGAVQFQPLETVKAARISIINDGLSEGAETVFLSLSNVVGGVLDGQTSAVMTINDDGGALGIGMLFGPPTVDESARVVYVLISRSGNADVPVTVEIMSQDGSATAGRDYEPVHTFVGLGVGQTFARVDLPIILNDSLPEGNETLSLVLTNPAGGARLATNSSLEITILDNERGFGFAQPTYSPSEDSGVVTITVRRNWDTTNIVSVDFTTRDGAARAGIDYIAQSGTLTFATNELSKSFNVPILNNALDDGDRSFTVTLERPVGEPILGSGEATVFIINNDTGIQFESDQYVVSEGGAQVVLTVLRGDDGTNFATVQYTMLGVTADSGLDFVAESGTLSFAPGKTSRPIAIPILDDKLIEDDETFQVILSNVSSGVSLGTKAVAQVTIRDDERPGSVDEAFDLKLTGYDEYGVRHIVVHPNGTALVSSVSSNFLADGVGRFPILRLNTDGSLDPNFAVATPFPAFGAWGLAVQPDEKVLFGVQTTFGPGFNASPIHRYFPDGTRDTTFVSCCGPFDAASGWATAITLLPDGRILVGGEGLDGSAANLIRLLANGTRDTDFRVVELGLAEPITALAVQSNGDIVFGGKFGTVNGVARQGIGRVHSDGVPDASFADVFRNSVAPNVFSILAPPDDKLIVAGSFEIGGTVVRHHLVRLRADGTVDPTFNTADGVSGPIRAVARQRDGKVLIGGEFLTVQGVSRNGVARLNADGSLDPGFDIGTGTDALVKAVAILPSGDILMGGRFTSVNGVVRFGLARLRGGEPLRILSIQHSPGGPTDLSVTGRAGINYELQASSDLASWHTERSVTPLANPFLLRDTNGPVRRFYRVEQLAP